MSLPHRDNVLDRRGGVYRSATPWIPRFVQRREAALRLFCFPFAGGDAVTIFRRWPERLPPEIEICPIQLPGRGARVAEPLLNNLPTVVQEVRQAIGDYFEKPFAFFGHSMGAMIAFELARLLRKEEGIEPLHLFVSGRTAPQLPNPDPPTYNLPKAEFFQELERMNGTSPEVLQHPELMELMLPILRADFQICQTHSYVEEPPLQCPITAFGGLKEDSTMEEFAAWKEQSSGAFALHMLPGDHFFIKTDEGTVLRLIVSHLLRQCVI